MATRYWVGGAGNWSSTTKWSATSGGGSGASVPTAVDDVIFDASSGGKFTATVDTAQSVNSITITPSSGAGVLQIALSAQLTTGALTTTGTAGNNRIWFRGTTFGIAFNFVVNGAVSISDCDFRNIYVVGTSAPISGTRIGNLGGCRGITFSTPKTVYWNQAAGGNWSGNNWAPGSGGTVNTDNFPLAQDTAVIENTGLNASATVTVDSVMSSVAMSGIDMSNRTNAMTLATSVTTPIIYGDWKNGSGTTLTGTGILTFSKVGTQTITSAGKTFTQPITINSFGGTVELADALNIGSNNLTVTNGTFNTKNFNVTAGALVSSNSNVRTITLGSSTLTLGSGGNSWATGTSTNLTLNAGTSTISLTNTSATTFDGGGLTFYNVTFVGTTATTYSFGGANTFNNVTVTAPASAGLMNVYITANQTINGTLTVAGASPVRRIFVSSGTLDTTRTLTVGTLTATDCDFQDITIAGGAAGSSQTRAGDRGGNSGITFPAPKTVYWNLAGTQNWSATGWCPSSGGTPDINQFPLAQDTAVFNNSSAITLINIERPWAIGTLDMSSRTSGMGLNGGTTALGSPFIYGDFKFGTGVSCTSSTGAYNFAKRGTQTITSNGVQFECPITINSSNTTVQLADALSISSIRTFTLTSGTFDAVSYNVTVGLVNISGGSTRALRMGSGTWTLSGTGTVWDASTVFNLNFTKGTANITLSDTSTTSRTFDGGYLAYNKLTIGGTTGTSTFTIIGDNAFSEFASTKTVAHTIALGSYNQKFGKWTITGTAGNNVTLTGTSTGHTIEGACTSGINYLTMGSIGFNSSSPGEFYAGVNSTGTAGPPVYRTAPPATSTRYWVGGTGNWSSTTKWSTLSGGSGGASVPRSTDDVIFDSASNATAYTATVDATIRFKSLTIAGPLSGNVTIAGGSSLFAHGNISLPASGITWSYTGPMYLTGSSSGNTVNTNGNLTENSWRVAGVGASWSLSSALNLGVYGLTVENGTLNLNGYNFTGGTISSTGAVYGSRELICGSSTITLSTGGSSPIDFGTTQTNGGSFTLTANTSQITFTTNNFTINGNGKTFYNVTFSTPNNPITINGANTFNNLTFGANTLNGLTNITFNANQTVNGTLTCSAPADPSRRLFLISNTIGTARTLAVAAFSGTDVDFRDIAVTGAGAPISGTRLGDAKGNSGITFPAPKTVYVRATGGDGWESTTMWSATSGGPADSTQFPLAQDTAIFPASTYPASGSTIYIAYPFNIGTIDMSLRTSNTVTLWVLSNFQMFGNWINGTGTSLTGTRTITFAGRGAQSITSAGKTWPHFIDINSLGGTVTLQDAITISQSASTALSLTRGTFNAGTYNVTLSGALGGFTSSNSNTRTLGIGSGTWSIAGNGTTWNVATSTNLTVTGTGTIKMTSGSSKTFDGGGAAYTNITLDQGGAGTLTINGNNTFKDITNTYKATGATAINFGTTTQRLDTFSAAGESGRVLTIQGTSASSPATLIETGTNKPNVNYLTIIGVRAFDLETTWYAGANSTNSGSLGWIFSALPSAGGTGNFFLILG